MTVLLVGCMLLESRLLWATEVVFGALKAYLINSWRNTDAARMMYLMNAESRQYIGVK